MAHIPAPPKGTKGAGKELWEGILTEYTLGVPEMALLREAVATVDLLQAGDLTAVESRQQRITLARLLAAMRLPDEKGGANRPQLRAIRGTYGK